MSVTEHRDCPYCPGGHHRERIESAAKWIADAPSEQERNYRWGVIEDVAGMFAVSVVGHIKEFLRKPALEADQREDWEVADSMSLADAQSGLAVTATIWRTPDGPVATLSSSGADLNAVGPAEYALSLKPGMEDEED